MKIRTLQIYCGIRICSLFWSQSCLRIRTLQVESWEYIHVNQPLTKEHSSLKAPVLFVTFWQVFHCTACITLLPFSYPASGHTLCTLQYGQLPPFFDGVFIYTASGNFCGKGQRSILSCSTPEWLICQHQGLNPVYPTF